MVNIAAPNVVRLYGTRRSGNHIVCHWIASHFPPSSVLWIHDVKRRALHRHLTKHFVAPSSHGLTKPLESPYISRNASLRVLQPPLVDVADEHAVEDRVQPQLILLSYEDQRVPKEGSHSHAGVRGTQNDVTVVLVRSFRNVQASWLRKRMRGGLTNIWPRHARWARDNPNRTVLYDTWLASSNEKDRVRHMLCLPIDDDARSRAAEALRCVPRMGGGSSFTGCKRVPTAAELVERHALVSTADRNDAESAEIVQLNNDLFGAPGDSIK